MKRISAGGLRNKYQQQQQQSSSDRVPPPPVPAPPKDYRQRSMHQSVDNDSPGCYPASWPLARRCQQARPLSIARAPLVRPSRTHPNQVRSIQVRLDGRAQRPDPPRRSPPTSPFPSSSAPHTPRDCHPRLVGRSRTSRPRCRRPLWSCDISSRLASRTA